MKKVFTIILSILLICSALPTPASAGGGLAYWTNRINEVKGNESTAQPEPEAAPTEAPDAYSLTRQWARSNGYTFDIYGSTSVDLTPVSGFLSMLAENNIFITPKEMMVSEDEKRSSSSLKIADSFYIMYTVLFEKNTASITIQMPNTYRPQRQVMIFLLMYMFGMDEDEAVNAVEVLYYNIIEEYSILTYGNAEFSLYEPRYSDGSLAPFVAITVDIPAPDPRSVAIPYTE